MDLSVRPSLRNVLSTLALGITTLVMTSPLGAAASAGVVSPGSVLKATMSGIAEQSSAHVVFIARSSSPPATEKIIADVGTTSGTETLFEGKADLAIKVTPTDAYLTGNASGLTTLFGLSAAQAKKLGSDWESWKSGTHQYANLKSDLTMSSVTALLPKAEGTKVSTGTDTAAGVKVYVLRWETAATSSLPKMSKTLTVSAEGAYLPIEQTATASGGVKVTTTLSKWGEVIAVSPPPAASTISSSKITG
jgi:hypothetical protein